MRETTDLAEAPPGSRPKIGNLTRLINAARQKMRPATPTSLDFEVRKINCLANFRKIYRKKAIKEGNNRLSSVNQKLAFMTYAVD